VTEEVSNADVRAIAGRIVAAYLKNNQMPPDQVPSFIGNVLDALRNGSGQAGAEQTPDAAGYTPAVPIKKSVGADRVTCLVCGKPFKSLKRHLQASHGMDEQQYRAAFNLPAGHPLVSRTYSRQRAELAKRIGLGEKRRGRGRSRKTA